jgi:hypothetical protein
VGGKETWGGSTPAARGPVDGASSFIFGDSSACTSFMVPKAWSRLNMTITMRA